MMIVSTPRPAGQPSTDSMPMNNNNSDRPVTTSGITSGALDRLLNAKRPRKLPNLTKAMAIIMPKNVAIVAAQKAMNNDSPNAFSTCSLVNKLAYHFVENPDQTDTSLPALKLNRIITVIGT